MAPIALVSERKREMKLVKMVLAIALLTLTSASTVHAGTKILASAPAPLGAGNTMFCDVTNLDPVDSVDVATEIMDVGGNVIVGPSLNTIPPSTGGDVGSNNPLAAWCRFTVNGSTKNLRGMAVYDNGTSYTMSLPAY
jgi:hypothetical protein